MIPRALVPLLALVLAACGPTKDGGIDPNGETFDAVTQEEIVSMTGTEPFWNLQIESAEALWTTPDNPNGTRFAVTRFAGNNGLGFTGTLDGAAITATLTPGQCSDGMSDRVFPYVATIALGEETLQGCGYTDQQPYTGEPAP